MMLRKVKRMRMSIIKYYSELIQLPTFEERFKYLKLDGIVSDQTFGGHRYLNQVLYHSYDWKRIKREVILRDNGCDLAHEDHPISGHIYIHHINPITIEDILNHNHIIFDLENLISSSFQTHNAIHYGSFEMLSKEPIKRTKNDTCPWR